MGRESSLLTEYRNPRYKWPKLKHKYIAKTRGEFYRLMCVCVPLTSFLFCFSTPPGVQLLRAYVLPPFVVVVVAASHPCLVKSDRANA